MSRVSDCHPVPTTDVDAVVRAMARATARAATFNRMVSAVSPVAGSVADAP